MFEAAVSAFEAIRALYSGIFAFKPPAGVDVFRRDEPVASAGCLISQGGVQSPGTRRSIPASSLMILQTVIPPASKSPAATPT